MESVKKLFSITILLIAVSTGACFSQELIFCEGIDQYNNPINPGNVFRIDREGSNIWLLVEADSPCNSKIAYFDVYTVDDYRNETYYKGFNMDTSEDWDRFCTYMPFYYEGRYKIYVYNGNERLLASGMIGIKYR